MAILFFTIRKNNRSERTAPKDATIQSWIKDSWRAKTRSVIAASGAAKVEINIIPAKNAAGSPMLNINSLNGLKLPKNTDNKNEAARIVRFLYFQDFQSTDFSIAIQEPTKQLW